MLLNVVQLVTVGNVGVTQDVTSMLNVQRSELYITQSKPRTLIVKESFDKMSFTVSEQVFN